MKKLLILLALVAAAGCSHGPTRLSCNQLCAWQDLACERAEVIGLHFPFKNAAGGVMDNDRYTYQCIQPSPEAAPKIAGWKEQALRMIGLTK